MKVCGKHSLAHICEETGFLFRENGVATLKQRNAYCVGNYEEVWLTWQ